jgi:hypothetical protein
MLRSTTVATPHHGIEVLPPFFRLNVCNLRVSSDVMIASP